MVMIWHPSDRIHPVELCSLVCGLRLGSLPDVVQDMEELVPIRDEHYRRDTNLMINQAGNPRLMAEKGPAFEDALRETCARNWGQAYQLKGTAFHEHFDELGNIFRYFFSRPNAVYGMAGLLFSRFAKTKRVLYEDRGIAHTRRRNATDVGQLLDRHSLHRSVRLTPNFHYPIGRFAWKRYADAYPRSHEIDRPVLWSCSKIGLCHDLFLPEGTHYHEERFTVGQSVLEYELLREGVIPNLACENDSPLIGGDMCLAVLLTLEVIEIDEYRNVWGRDLTLEFDPRTLELVSIRTYLEPFSVFALIASAFHHWYYSYSIVNYIG